MKINLRSLAYFTDLSILKFDGRVEDHGDYYLAESSDNPSYFLGNLLVMKNSPKKGDCERWTRLFKHHFSHQPLVKHITFGWDSPAGESGDIQEFQAGGFDVEKSLVLTAKPMEIRAPPKINTEVQVRTLQSRFYFQWNWSLSSGGNASRFPKAGNLQSSDLPFRPSRIKSRDANFDYGRRPRIPCSSYIQIGRI